MANGASFLSFSLWLYHMAARMPTTNSTPPMSADSPPPSFIRCADAVADKKQHERQQIHEHGKAEHLPGLALEQHAVADLDACA